MKSSARTRTLPLIFTAVALMIFQTPFGIRTAAIAGTSSAKAPELIGQFADWFNIAPGTNYRLYGKNGVLNRDPYAPGKNAIVLIDFWEYTCINCKHVLPYVQDLADRYKSSGLVVLGIHTPEFTFHHAKPYVVRGAKHLSVTFPTLLDQKYKNWNAYNNEYWPCSYVIDHTGKIAYSNDGEGDYYATEQLVRKLLLQANPGETLPKPLLSGEPQGT